ncbi:MAG TPA: hypothetical protein VG206_05560 [Terriglobia bacterium]|nr:hypothetical protein [Terriglobia bacterium]
MTVSDLEESVRGSLRQAGLLQYVEESETQFVEFPDGWLAEIVLKDGSKLPEVESIVRKFKTDLQREQAIELDEIVRPVWNIAKIERIGPSVTVPGLESALRFNVTLQSGDLACTATVDVSEAALGMIRERLSKTGAPEQFALQEIVSEFMKFELSHGGKSYWDPRRDSRLTLDAGALMYVFGQRDAYERLKQSIDEVFYPGMGQEQESIERFVRSMNYAHGMRKIGRFQDALTDLPGPGGAYSSSQRSPTSNYELYGLLFDDEKRVLESYYLGQLAEAEKKYPHLKAQYPAVFN